jgi:roadblock/LC7 domain-containing protein
MALASLLDIPGVIAALRFLDDGSLIESVGDMDRQHFEFAAELCYANGRITHHASDMLGTLSGMRGWPPRGWMMIGDELSICAIANVVCFVRNASFDKALRALSAMALESQ